MRKPKPWYRKQTRTWYVQIGTKQINLGKNKHDAWNKYYEIMRHTGRYNPGEQRGVAELLKRYIAWGEANLGESTVRKIRFHLDRFTNYIGESMRIDGLKPLHVQEWIDDNYCGRSDAYKHTAISVVQSAMRWAREHGHIELNPIERVRKPTPSVREFFVPSGRWEQLVAACRGADFRDLVVCMLSTGARPKELRLVEARHFDPQFGRLVYPILESKGKSRQRVIYLDATARTIVERRSREFPTGPIFRNSRGGPWTKDAVAGRFRRLKSVMGMPALCAYSLRHSFAHWHLTTDTDSHVVSKLLGHVDGRMLHTRYGHLDQDSAFMIASVCRVQNPLEKVIGLRDLSEGELDIRTETGSDLNGKHRASTDRQNLG